MRTLYETICALCSEHGIKPGKLCADLGFSRSTMSDLKMGRKKTLSADYLSKVAAYFHVSVDYLLGAEAEEENKRLVNNDEALTEYLDELRRRPEKRMLFSVTRNATKAQVEAIVKMIEEMQGN